MTDVMTVQSDRGSHNMLDRFKNLFTHERRNWVAIVLAAGLCGFGIGNGHTTQGAVAHISDQLGQTSKKLAVTACERGVARQVAGQAIAAANTGEVPVPDISAAKDGNCAKAVLSVTAPR